MDVGPTNNAIFRSGPVSCGSVQKYVHPKHLDEVEASRLENKGRIVSVQVPGSMRTTANKK